MIYKIFITEENLAVKYNAKLISSNFKYLQNSLNKEIVHYEKDGVEYYTFFNYVNFVVVSSEDYNNLSNTKVDHLLELEQEYIFYAYWKKETINNEEISLLLRNSSTLKINEHNSYDNKNFKLIFSERGFVFNNNRNKYDLTSHFNRSLLLFMLVMAYNNFSEGIINDVIIANDEKNHIKMIEKRNQIYEFDLKCFFNNPVKQNRYEASNIWRLLKEHYYVDEKYQEVKNQVTNFTHIIENQQIEIQQNKEKKFERTVAIIGILIAATSLVGLYLDLKELGLF